MLIRFRIRCTHVCYIFTPRNSSSVYILEEFVVINLSACLILPSRVFLSSEIGSMQARVNCESSWKQLMNETRSARPKSREQECTADRSHTCVCLPGYLFGVYCHARLRPANKLRESGILSGLRSVDLRSVD